MPNRTIYLPDDVDRMVDELGVNLSRLTQDAVRALASERAAERSAQANQLDEIRQRVAAVGLTYPAGHLAAQRAEAGDDLR